MEPTPESLKEQGLAHFGRGKRQEALASFEAAAAGFERAGNMAGLAEMQNNIGVIYRLGRNWSLAAQALRRAEAGFAEAGDQVGRAQVWGNLADLHASRGEREQAADYYGRAAQLFAAEGDRERQSQVLRAFSLLRLRQWRLTESLDLMARSLQARSRLSLPQKLFKYMLGLALKLLAGG